MYVIAPKSAKPTTKPIALVDGEDVVPEERERQDRLGGAALDEQEERRAGRRRATISR